MKESLRKNKTLLKLAKILKGESDKLFLLDYPADFTPRYTNHPHPTLKKIISKNNKQYINTLKSFHKYYSHLAQIPIYEQKASTKPCWINGFLPGLDTLALYSLVSNLNPNKYLEVGSGFSTRVVRKAITDHKLKTKITTIDPDPRAEINAITNKIYKTKLEDTDLKIFKTLKAGDMLYIDGTHRALMNSDVVVFFLEILPNLAKGVIVHIHDIYLPFDYPANSSEGLYSEQYMLAMYLLHGQNSYDIILPNYWVSTNKNLASTLNTFWAGLPKEVEKHGGGFWFIVS